MKVIKFHAAASLSTVLWTPEMFPRSSNVHSLKVPNTSTRRQGGTTPQPFPKQLQLLPSPSFWISHLWITHKSGQKQWTMKRNMKVESWDFETWTWSPEQSRSKFRSSPSSPPPMTHECLCFNRLTTLFTHLCACARVVNVLKLEALSGERPWGNRPKIVSSLFPRSTV